MMAKTASRNGVVPTLVVGLGETGLSAARYLERAGEPFEVVDSRDQPPAIEAFRRNWPEIPVRLGRFGREKRSSCMPVSTASACARCAAGLDRRP